jgi:hypothetical protein
VSQQEFELYLKRLSRGLRLTSRQRAQISDELRDHLEERLEELADAGVPRDQAALVALDEFGDASVLAGRLTTIARLKRRRFLTHLSLSSVALLVVAFFTAFAFRPEERPVERPPQVLAENIPQPKPVAKASAETAKTQLLPAQTEALERAADARKIPVGSRVADEHPLGSNSNQNRKT